MSDDAAAGMGVAAWMLARVLAIELAESGVVPPKRMRKLVSTLLEMVGELDRTVELSPEALATIRKRLEELRRSASLNPRDGK
jgi:hypothetical protein